MIIPEESLTHFGLKMKTYIKIQFTDSIEKTLEPSTTIFLSIVSNSKL